MRDNRRHRTGRSRDRACDQPGRPAVLFTRRRSGDRKEFRSPESLDWELLDWTARRTVAGKRGATRADASPIFERLSMSAETWCEMVHHFGRLFYNVAGPPQQIEAARSRQTNRRFHASSEARSLFAARA